MKRRRSLTEAVLQIMCCTVSASIPPKLQIGSPIKQAHNIQVPPYRSMPCVDRNYHF